MRRQRVLSLAAVGGLLLGGVGLASAPASATPFGFAKLTAIQKRHVSGDLAEALGPQNATSRAIKAGKAVSAPACSQRLGADIKVNQNCLNVSDSDLAGRGQSQNETWISVNPNNRGQLVATYNDYRRGDGTCGVTYSSDGGKSWTDATAPNGFVRGGSFAGAAREYFQSGGDTSVAWDTRGNAYLSCQEFSRGSGTSPNPDDSSAFEVYRSTGTGGASFNFTGRPVAEHDDTAGAGNFLLDKQLMTVDNHTSSPFRDNVYVTWTTFAADGTAYIFSSHSSDYGEHFSAPVLVSSDTSLCAPASGVPTPQGRCNNNQFSEPVTASDGSLYVSWANYNTTNSGNDNHFQVLLARSTDGGKSFSTPVKVADYYDLPDCDTYQGQGSDPGRDCVPEKGSSTNSIFRATNYPNVVVDPANPKHVVVTTGSYVNADSQESSGCTPDGLTAALGSLYTGVKDGGCNNGMVVSSSTDGGATFTGGATDVRKLPVISDAPGQRTTDQYWQGTAFSPSGTLVTTYYDRQYGDDETTGASDITLTTSRDLTHFTHTRVTTSSLPAPTQFSGQFYGDYIGVDATATTAYPVWSDTRNPELFLCQGTGTPGNPPKVCQGSASNGLVANDEDIFTAAVPIG